MRSLVYAVAVVEALFGSGAAMAAEKTVTLRVEGMTCASCPYIVKKSLTRLDGVKEAKVSLEPARAVVKFDDQKITPEALADATLAAGFPSSVEGQ